MILNQNLSNEKTLGACRCKKCGKAITFEEEINNMELCDDCLCVQMK